jgi:hypothetical protein
LDWDKVELKRKDKATLGLQNETTASGRLAIIPREWSHAIKSSSSHQSIFKNTFPFSISSFGEQQCQPSSPLKFHTWKLSQGDLELIPATIY